MGHNERYRKPARVLKRANLPDYEIFVTYNTFEQRVEQPVLIATYNILKSPQCYFRNRYTDRL